MEMKRKTGLKAFRTAILTACLSAVMLATVLAKPAGPAGGGAFWQVWNFDNPVLRLHVVANSNCPGDQYFKAQTAVQVLRILSGRCDEAIEAGSLSFLREMMPELRERLARFAAAEGQSEIGITAALVSEHFPLRAYGREIYPAGEYQALKVVIGAGEGENWWCLLFPPLCLPMVQFDPSTQVEGEADRAGLSSPGGGGGFERAELKHRREPKEGRWKLKVWEQLYRWMRNN